jgi:hypothetical protein
VLGFTVTGGKIVAIDILADPARLSQLDSAVLKRVIGSTVLVWTIFGRHRPVTGATLRVKLAYRCGVVGTGPASVREVVADPALDHSGGPQPLRLNIRVGPEELVLPDLAAQTPPTSIPIDGRRCSWTSIQ